MVELGHRFSDLERYTTTCYRIPPFFDFESECSLIWRSLVEKLAKPQRDLLQVFSSMASANVTEFRLPEEEEIGRSKPLSLPRF
jgi:hypothetical protein